MTISVFHTLLLKSLISLQLPLTILSFLGALAKFRKASISFIMSVCQRRTTWLPLDGFS